MFIIINIIESQQDDRKKVHYIFMKYYSEKLKTLYETIEELKSAEEAHDEELAKKQELLEAKRLDAKAVEDAYKNTFVVRKQANATIREADEQYAKVRDEFIAKYGAYHMTYRNNEEDGQVCKVSDIVDDIFNAFPFKLLK